MGTSNTGALASRQATRDAASMAALLEQTLAEAKRGADLSQVLVDQLGGTVPAPEVAPEEVNDAP